MHSTTKSIRNTRSGTSYLTAATFFAVCFASWSPTLNAHAQIANADLVFAEQNGFVAVEAEHFFKQMLTETRKWHLTHSELTPQVSADGDPNHVAGASGGAYLEILPDTRRTHDDKLIRGENFSPEPGKLAVLHYKVNITTPGRYYVWVRAYSTGSEDNGIHVGLDGAWPASGQRMQWCEGKQTWRWESKQRTDAQHCGEPYKIYLDIAETGEHTISFSMREDGFEFDKWLMTTDKNFRRPEGIGPSSDVLAGSLPRPFKFVQPKRTFPEHWGNPPLLQTKDLRRLPGGYGRGSSTLAVWIQEKLDADAASLTLADSALLMPATLFAKGDHGNYYLDRKVWMAINPEEHTAANASATFPFPTGNYNVTLRAVGENDGRSTYEVDVAERKLGEFTCPLSKQIAEEGRAFHKTWNNVHLTDGDIVTVRSAIGSQDGSEFSRARWAAVAFDPADPETRKRAQPFLQKQTENATVKTATQRRTDSPTKSVSDKPLFLPRAANGDGSIAVTGERKKWHNITLTLDGPFAHEQDNAPNPFTDYRMTVSFKHTSGKEYVVPGYFAADGDAKNTSAESGTKWRAHFAPDLPGAWSYRVDFRQGKLAALSVQPTGERLSEYDGKEGTFNVVAIDAGRSKSERDLRVHGRLQYVGKRYLQFAETKQYFLKVGADAPETLLAYKDFDNTQAMGHKVPLKSWSPHVGDWRDGDPSWKDGKGKGLIGAINYLSGKGCNAFSFLTYNAGGDGDNVWPFIHRDDKLHYDCSKLDQWATVFEHGTQQGMYLHFKMQETENDNHDDGYVPESLDGGNLGTQRKLYCRELIARFAHNLALNWNLGEENTQSTANQNAMIDYIADLDPYDHNIVLHTYPNQQDKVYRPLLGDKSRLTGLSLQNSSLETTHAQTVKWVSESTAAGKPWVVAFDESGSAAHAQCPDLGYRGFDGRDNSGEMIYTQHKVRKQTLWGQLMGGGAGCEYYFGYKFAENDLVCEDWRSRDQSWDYCRIAIQFFHQNRIPFWEMQNHDELIGNPQHGVSKYCFSNGDNFLVYLPEGGTSKLDLGNTIGRFKIEWFNPRDGGELKTGSVRQVSAGQQVELGLPPTDPDQDWLAVIRKQ